MEVEVKEMSGVDVMLATADTIMQAQGSVFTTAKTLLDEKKSRDETKMALKERLAAAAATIVSCQKAVDLTSPPKIDKKGIKKKRKKSGSKNVTYFPSGAWGTDTDLSNVLKS